MTAPTTPTRRGKFRPPANPALVKQWRRWRVPLAAVAAVLVTLAIVRVATAPDTTATRTSLNHVLAMIDAADSTASPGGAARVTGAELDDSARVITLTTADGATWSAGYPLNFGADLADRLAAHHVDVEVSVPHGSSTTRTLMLSVLPVVGLGLILLMAVRLNGRGMSKMGGNRNQPVEIPSTRFSEVVGADEAVADLREVVDYLRDPARFDVIGARAPRGVLLAGPPGVGKTLLARAVAGEAGVAFMALCGSDFTEMFVGVGARRARDLFASANRFGKAIIFIDEIEGVGRKRGGAGSTPGANDERENTLNALLVEMDGFARNNNVVVLAATNRADLLDPALTRPGRFDRTIQVTAPDRLGRQELFRIYLRDKCLGPNVDVDEVAERFAIRTPGMTGADIANLTNEAALAAARDASPVITHAHLEEGLERVALGPARTSALVTDKARTISAWHEAGHAVTALAQPAASQPKRVSIVPRGATGGVTWFGGDDDEAFATAAQLSARLVVLYGGRAAEEVLLDGDYTRGAAADIAAATSMATSMVCEWGMSSLGPVALDAQQLLGEPAESVRIEIVRLCDAALATARQLVAEHLPTVRAVAEALLERENLDERDLDELRCATAGAVTTSS